MIAPSIPAVEATSYVPPRSRVSEPIAIPGPRRVTIGTSTYLITEIPSSSLPSSSNANPPPPSRGPSSRHIATSQVHTAVSRPIAPQAYIPPVVSGGYVHVSRGHIATSSTYLPTSGMYIPTSGMYIPSYGVSHGASHAMTYASIMGRSMDRFLHLMEAGIHNLLTLLTMAL